MPSGKKTKKERPINPAWRRKGAMSEAAGPGRARLWIAAAAAVCALAAGLWLALPSGGTEREPGHLQATVGKIDRSAAVAAGVSIPNLLSDIYADMNGRRNFLERYDGFSEAMDLLADSYDLAMQARAGDGSSRERAFAGLADGMAVLRRFGEELEADDDPEARRVNAALARRIASLSRVLGREGERSGRTP